MKKRFNPIKDKSSEIIEYLMASPDIPKDEALEFKIRLSVEEAVENVVRYAYEGGIGWLEAGTSLSHDGLKISALLDVDRRIGGTDPDFNLSEPLF